MASVVLMSGEPAGRVLPALPLLSHEVRVCPPSLSSLADAPPGSVVLVDARIDLVAARSLCRSIASTMPDLAVVVVISEGGLAALTPEWRVADVVLPGAGPAELDVRIRLASARVHVPETAPTPEAPPGDLVIDESGYSARLRGVPLDLTYREFELLKYLASSPGRVCTRAQILDEVWGHDYYGGTRTVDVHVRRLRAKLGPEHDMLIGTVRNVGYRFNSQSYDNHSDDH